MVLRFSMSVIGPYISTLLQAYVQLNGFDMFDDNDACQLVTTCVLRFVTTTMPPLHPTIAFRACNESVVVGPGNTVPIVVDFTKLSILTKWENKYVPMADFLLPQDLKEYFQIWLLINQYYP